MAAVKKIALIVGSSRVGGNAPGIAAWLSPLIQKQLNLTSATTKQSYEVVVVHPTDHPLGPVVWGAKMPMQIRDPADYPSQTVRDWSAFVSSFAGFVFLTPEYNGGYPGDLKNALDHVYWEWEGKAASIVSYGGGGGGRSAAQLTDILKNVRLRLTSKAVNITVPGPFVSGEDRVLAGSAHPEFLGAYVQPVEEATGELLALLQEEKKAEST